MMPVAAFGDKSPKSSTKHTGCVGLSLYLAGDATLDAGLRRGWQHDKAVEFFTGQVVGTLAFLWRCGGIRCHPQEALSARNPLLIRSGKVVAASAVSLRSQRY